LTKLPKIYDGEKTASSTNLVDKTGHLPAKNWNYIHAYHLVQVSTQSGFLKTLILRPETLLIQERAENALEAIGIGNDFLSRTQAA
jgi:hypothetical protein